MQHAFQPYTKFVITLGPASATPEVFPTLLDAGVDVVRLNFSHGTHEQKSEWLKVVREAAKGAPLAVMGDLCGPKIRLGTIDNNAMPLVVGDEVTIQREPVVGKDHVISSNYPCLVDDLQIGQKVLIDDGALRMTVVGKGTNTVRCRVTLGGILQSNKGLNLPSTKLNIPSVTEKDWQDIDWAIENGVDYLALSFVRSAEDMLRVRHYLERKKSPIHLIAKIEMPQAVENLASIIEVSDAILVARGDLGVEMDLTRVPVIQKQIVSAAQEAGKPVIVATQMLQSMVNNPMPTRAEVSDVANAIIDGADAVMLSGETAVGKYPLEAVQALRDIAEQTEAYLTKNGTRPQPPKLLQMTHHRTAAIAHGAREIAHDINARMVAVWSQAGGSARYLSKNRFAMPIVAFSSDPLAVRRMALYYGVTPICAQCPKHFDDLPKMIDSLLLERKMVEQGDRMVVAAGSPLGIVGVTNSLSVHVVGKYNS